MTDQDIKATLTISLLAAYADSHKHDRERDEIRRIAEGLAGSAEINLASLYQDVLFKRTSLEAAAKQLQSEESRQLAYEMAVCVCDADGSTSEKELAFLKELRAALDLDAGFAQATLDETASMAEAPLAVSPSASTSPTGSHPAAAISQPSASPTPATSAPSPALQPSNGFGHSAGTATQSAADASTLGLGAGAALGATLAGQDNNAQLPVPTSAAAPASGTTRPSTMSPAEIDQKILRAAITNGAIELLPESLSTMAIIPLQMRLVYQIGESYGYSLDKGHIRDFLATVGIGMTSQYLEQAARKLLTGLLGKKRSKGLFGKAGKQAISSGMSFAATYALGHVANQYYAGGRTLSTDVLKNTYNHVLQRGQSLQTQYQPQIEAEARTLDAGKVMAMVSGRG
ncbi:MAG: TerB family tellurite resistance protein [Lautropia sp.]|nr:TerB family tellurite resistance protein [Lautropia sp.]